MFDHVANAGNGNAVKKVATTTSKLAGGTSGLKIYQVSLAKLVEVCGANVLTVMKAIDPDETKDWSVYRRSDHEDRDGNLPVPPGKGVVYREYHVPGNKLPMPGYLRLVYEGQNKWMFVTPTHYDVWIPDREAADRIGGTKSAAGEATAQSPFFQVVQP